MNQKKIFALGFFDGVHLGHQKILAECCDLAEKTGASACAFTFLQHPQSLFTHTPPLLINTHEDRKRLLQQFGIGPVYSYPVTREVMGMPWKAFLEELISYGAVGFVCGDDFRFGHKSEGTCDKLREFCKEFGLTCTIVPQQDMDGSRISSTRIRELLEQGQLDDANRLLGHPHVFTGVVQTGKQLGRTISFPTANLTFPADVIVPKFGVYVCKATVDGNVYTAVTNVGTRPTVNGDGVTAEAHLLDFQGDLYGKTLTLAFYAFLRPEKKFDSVTQLQEEILKNTAETRNFFAKSE